jgi:hypothetical protein
MKFKRYPNGKSMIRNGTIYNYLVGSLFDGQKQLAYHGFYQIADIIFNFGNHNDYLFSTTVNKALKILMKLTPGIYECSQ